MEDQETQGEFEERTVTSRGKTYRLRELSAEEYDKCVKLATSAPDEDGKPGRLDTVMLLRWMLTRSLIEPKMGLEDLGKLPFKVLGELGAAVNDIHFPRQPEGEEGEEGND